MSDESAKQLADATRRLQTELRLVRAASSSSGIAGMMRAVADMRGHAMWLIDRHGRVVARSAKAINAAPPEISVLLEGVGRDGSNTSVSSPLVIEPGNSSEVRRRHMLMPVARNDFLFAWLVMAESRGHFKGFDQILLERAAVHLASEYATQRRVARVSWNARSTLAYQMIHESIRNEDLLASADYLGIELGANRVVAYFSEPREASFVADEELLARRVAEELGVEILVARRSKEIALLIEVPAESTSPEMISRVKTAIGNLMTFLEIPSATVGISTVTEPKAIRRAYCEAREVALCGERFGSVSTRVITVDDLGPARLFIANNDVDVMRRFAHEVLGTLLLEGAGTNLIRTLHYFFTGGRSVREAAAGLGIHENTVRLRLARVHELTGLDVASDLNDQISAQTALLVLRLDGHPAMPSFDLMSSANEPRPPTIRPVKTHLISDSLGLH
jgi:sugar diacid utilization regulator